MEKKNQKKNKLKEKISKFFKSYNPILIGLIVVCIALIVININLTKSNDVYLFNGSNDYVDIKNGVVSLNYDINLLEGSDIEYVNKKDFKIVDYAIGYYVIRDNKYESVLAISSETSDEDVTAVYSLKKILEGISAFNISEPATNKFYFTKENKEALAKDGLYFIIEATTKNGDSIKEVIKLNVTKLTK